VVDCIKSRVPRRSTQGERAYETACHAKAYDLLRYLLPAATLTNLGLTINARALEHLLTKLLSDPLEEVHDIGVVMKHEAEEGGADSAQIRQSQCLYDRNRSSHAPTR
jgi:thymidylate synthase ThyX